MALRNSAPRYPRSPTGSGQSQSALPLLRFRQLEPLQAETEVESLQAAGGLGCNGGDSVAFSAYLGQTDDLSRPTGEVGPRRLPWSGGLVDVQRPTLAAVDAPLGGEVLDGLLGVVRGDVDVGGVAGAAHGT